MAWFAFDWEHFAAAMEPIAWFMLSLPVFVFTILQPPQSRWWLLPFNIIPTVQSYQKANQLAAVPGLDWLMAFTSLIYIIHSTSALYLERWTLTPSKKLSKAASTFAMLDAATLRIALRAWMNPRRLRLAPDVERIPQLNRACQTRVSSLRNPTGYESAGKGEFFIFAAKRIAQCLLLITICFGIEAGILFMLFPGARDFRLQHQTYFPWMGPTIRPLIAIPTRGLRISWHTPLVGAVTFRVLVLRSVYALHWAWLTYVILTVVHSLLAVFFVSVLRVDRPQEWPSLFGNPSEAFTIRRFWSRFWHQINTPSLLAYGKMLSRKVLRMDQGSGVEKTFLAAWVFGVSVVIHALVEAKTEPAVAPTDGNAMANIWRDGYFLGLNFAGGVMEIMFKRPLGKLDVNVHLKHPVGRVAARAICYVWVFAFFWCIVPPYQYPVQYKNAVQRTPFKVKMAKL